MTDRPRLIHWLAGLVAVLAFAWSGSALAVETYYVRYLSSIPLYTSVQAACNALHSTGSNIGYTTVNSTTWRCYYTPPPPNPQNTTTGQTVVLKTLADCPAGTVRNMTTGACDPIPKCPASAGLNFTGVPIGYEGSQQVPHCIEGCNARVYQVLKVYRYPAATDPMMTYGDFIGERTGGECSSSGTGNVGAGAGPQELETAAMSSTSGNGSDCPEGTVQGGIDSDGIPICMGTGTDPAPPKDAPTTTTNPPTTTTNADGTTTTTQSVTQQNSDGSSTTTTTTTTNNSDGSTTVTSDTTVTPSTSGSPGKTDSDPEDDKYDMCKLHPDLTVCKNSTVNGACEAISCTGDAIQCATLREAAQIQCRQKATEDELKASSLFAAGQATVSGSLTGLPTYQNGSTFAVGSTLDQTSWIGGGACYSDKSITVQGHTVVLPFSKVCDILLVLRYALMVVAALVSFRILSGSVIQG